MFDERAFIARLEAASPQELADLLMRPTTDEEKALRAYLGDERYQRMHSLALKRNVVRSVGRKPKGNVIVIHGIMGGELSVSSGGSGDLTWLNIFRLMRGWLDRLKLNAEGNGEENQKFKVRASGIMKRYYGELLLSLAQNWNVYAFFFDWRKNLDLAADMLNVQVSAWLGETKPFHIVAHSMGGLVARTFTKKYKARWKAAWDKETKGRDGGRLVMLGTPNYGSFVIPQTIVGIEGIVRKLALIDVPHNRQQVLDIINSFSGSYQMLPSPAINQEWARLYEAETYGKFSVPQTHLDAALAHHKFLSNEIDERRMIYVAGYGQPTFSNINNWEKLDNVRSYDVTLDGDGRVPHALGLLRRSGKSIPTYFIKENHGNLSSNRTILAALDELLENGLLEKGAMGELKQEVPKQAVGKSRGVAEEDSTNLAEQTEKGWDDDDRELEISMRRMRTRSVASAPAVPGADGEEQSMEEGSTPEEISPEENRVAETLMRGLLASPDGKQAEARKSRAESDAIEKATVGIGLARGDIEIIHNEQNVPGVKQTPIDAIAVGHYIHVEPQAAELALDRSISRALLGLDPYNNKLKVAKTDLILTQYTERGIIHGKLGQPFFMTDPRPLKNGRKGAERVIAIAGMGEPGLFGSPELTVLARELCWSLGRMKKQHLATVVIGAGEGNIPLREAISAWMDGIRRALTASKFDEGRQLLRVTFVERDPRKIRIIDSYLKQEVLSQGEQGLRVEYEGWSDRQLAGLKRDELKADRKDWERRTAVTDDYKDTAPTRLTLNLDAAKKTYRFGAISSDASVPEREVTIDPVLVMKANDELAGEDEPPMQLERGRFLEGLLMPDDLRRQLHTNAPLVMMLDATTARIHWEMVAQPELTGAPAESAEPDGGNKDQEFEFKKDFLGTTRGLTRQLRTTFAPPPEPPPPPQRVLRVLVVADPAEDAHLEGAQEEGAAVADLFESYNTVYAERASVTSTQVVRMFGPYEAKRTNVLRELMSRPYDVLHYAGHCVYKWDGDQSASGWIFRREPKELLSADELNRIDRIPKFVFSNACESGITPDRSGERTAALAPSFAEAFFARGVSNFVCTAWPVDDLAAREFALALYGGLLGIQVTEDNRYARADSKPMHLAMRDARIKIASTDNGVSTWGAYQHYGNPFFQYFISQGTGSKT